MGLAARDGIVEVERGGHQAGGRDDPFGMGLDEPQVHVQRMAHVVALNQKLDRPFGVLGRGSPRHDPHEDQQSRRALSVHC